MKFQVVTAVPCTNQMFLPPLKAGEPHWSQAVRSKMRLAHFNFPHVFFRWYTVPHPVTYTEGSGGGPKAAGGAL